MKKLVLFVGLALLASGAFAQFKIRTVANLDADRCTSGELENKSFSVSDGASGTDCTVGGGTVSVLCACDAGSYRAVNGGLAGLVEEKVVNVTVADDAAGTKPALVIPITSNLVTCTCNDATGCTASIAEPTVTSGYGRDLTITSTGTGNCEFADSAGVVEIGTTVVLEPTSVLKFVYNNAAWYNVSYKDNVP